MRVLPPGIVTVLLCLLVVFWEAGRPSFLSTGPASFWEADLAQVLDMNLLALGAGSSLVVDAASTV